MATSRPPQITDSFIAYVAPLAPDKADVFDLVLLILAKDLENKARRELSEKLADLPHAPQKITNSLALDDDVDVASPVLMRSSAVTEATLVEVARSRDQNRPPCDREAIQCERAGHGCACRPR